jgi:HTH-type transcriptional regulator / antitoxin HigA
MITNEKQFRSTRTVVGRLKDALQGIAEQANVTGLSDLMKIERDALSSQIEELEADLALYESLSSGSVKDFTANSLNELPDILIKARISRGMSQKDLAEFLGLKEQQVQRYEAEGYRSASLDRLIQVADALGVKMQKRAELVGSKSLESVDPQTWQAFPVAEMYRRGWFEDFAGSLAQARMAAAELVPSFLRTTYASYASPAFHRKSVRTRGQVHEAAIIAWEARIRQLSERNPPEAAFDRILIDETWLHGLVSLSLDQDGVAKAVDYLRKVGISLVVERHLPGTLLDGAALCSVDQRAIIGLTLRHDRHWPDIASR